MVALPVVARDAAPARQIYVAKLKDVEEEQSVGWGMFSLPYKTGKLVEACLPLFMEMNMVPPRPRPRPPPHRLDAAADARPRRRR